MFDVQDQIEGSKDLILESVEGRMKQQGDHNTLFLFDENYDTMKCDEECLSNKGKNC